MDLFYVECAFCKTNFRKHLNSDRFCSCLCRKRFNSKRFSDARKSIPKGSFEDFKNIKIEKTWIAKGYELFYCPGHPLSQSNGQVFVHRHVMMIKEGRLLKQKESAHHIDGNRLNNHPDNLELWTRPQPIGIRHHDKIIDCETFLRECGASVTWPNSL